MVDDMVMIHMVNYVVILSGLDDAPCMVNGLMTLNIGQSIVGDNNDGNITGMIGERRE